MWLRIPEKQYILVKVYRIGKWINKEYKNKCLQHTIEKRPQAME